MGIIPTRVAILGGGVAGCVLARRLGSMRHIEVDLLERRQRLGGSHSGVWIDGAFYDTAPTVFDIRHPLFAMFPGLNELFVEVEHRPRVITPVGAVDDYPPAPRHVLAAHGALAGARAVIDLVAGKARFRRRDSVAAFVRYYLGETIYRQSGLREYLERFFAAPEQEIDIAFARDRLEALADAASLRRNVGRALHRSLTGASSAGATAEPARCYVRPRDGFDAIFRHIAEDLRVEGVTIRLGAEVESIDRVGEEFLVTAGGSSRCYDRIISTIPPATAAACLGIDDERAGDAGGASMVSLFYRFSGCIDEPGDVFHNFTRAGAWRRVVVLSRYYGPIDGEEYFVVECVRRDVGPEALAEVARDVEEHLATLPFFDGIARYVGGAIIRDAWPLASAVHRARVAALERAILERGVDIAGRQGAFGYHGSGAIADAAQRLASRLDLRRDRVGV